MLSYTTLDFVPVGQKEDGKNESEGCWIKSDLGKLD